VVSQSESQWVVGTRESEFGSKNQPLHINKFLDVLHRVCIGPAVAGTQGSKHYPIRLMKDGIAPGDSNTIDKTNSLQLPYYYVDAVADIDTSRRTSTTLAKSGYYELNCLPQDIDPSVVDALTTLLGKFKTTIGDNKVRLPLYRSATGDIRFSPRIFESYAKNKDKESVELYAVDRVQEARKTTIDSDEYKRHNGGVRLIGSFNTVTVSSGYSKVVFVVRMVMMKITGTRTIGGIATTRSNAPSGANEEEWQEFIAHCASSVESGIPIRMLRSAMDDGINLKIGLARPVPVIPQLSPGLQVSAASPYLIGGATPQYMRR